MKATIIVIVFLTSCSIISQNYQPNSLVSQFNNSGKIEGLVVDYESSSSALAFTNITVKNTSISTTSDLNGQYTLKLKPGIYTLIFTFLGYKTVEVKYINVSAAYTTNLNQKMSPQIHNSELPSTSISEF